MNISSLPCNAHEKARYISRIDECAQRLSDAIKEAALAFSDPTELIGLQSDTGARTKINGVSRQTHFSFGPDTSVWILGNGVEALVSFPDSR